MADAYFLLSQQLTPEAMPSNGEVKGGPSSNQPDINTASNDVNSDLYFNPDLDLSQTLQAEDEWLRRVMARLM